MFFTVQNFQLCILLLRIIQFLCILSSTTKNCVSTFDSNQKKKIFLFGLTTFPFIVTISESKPLSILSKRNASMIRCHLSKNFYFRLSRVLFIDEKEGYLNMSTRSHIRVQSTVYETLARIYLKMVSHPFLLLSYVSSLRYKGVLTSAHSFILVKLMFENSYFHCSASKQSTLWKEVSMRRYEKPLILLKWVNFQPQKLYILCKRINQSTGKSFQFLPNRITFCNALSRSKYFGSFAPKKFSPCKFRKKSRFPTLRKLIWKILIIKKY